MEFKEYLGNAWAKHGDNVEQTAESIEAGIALCRSADDVSSLVHLTTHLYSEHIQRFTEGERKLREIGKSEYANRTPAEFAVTRAIAAFRLCGGTLDPAEDRMGLTPNDLARALAIATSALSVRDSERSEKFLKQALELAASVDLASADGLARSLAIAGNNTAASLEETPILSEQRHAGSHDPRSVLCCLAIFRCSDLSTRSGLDPGVGQGVAPSRAYPGCRRRYLLRHRPSVEVPATSDPTPVLGVHSPRPGISGLDAGCLFDAESSPGPDDHYLTSYRTCLLTHLGLL